MGNVKRVRVPRDFKDPALAYARYMEAVEEASCLRAAAEALKKDNRELRRLVIKTRHEHIIVKQARKLLRRSSRLQACIDFEADGGDVLTEMRHGDEREE